MLAPGRSCCWQRRGLGAGLCLLCLQLSSYRWVVPPGRDQGTGNVILLLEGVREELRRAVLARGHLSAFAMILCSNGTELLGDSSWQGTDTSHCRPW